jgi:peptide/nickel transport system substrate-binding protein
MKRVRNDAPSGDRVDESDDETASAADSARGTTRRAALAALGSTVATSGCVRRVEAILNRRTPEQVSLTIKAPPADDDVQATRIARFLATRLKEVGIEAQVTPLAREELWRNVLLNHDFDLYVGQLPKVYDPDRLRSLLHSRFDAEPGWQNPFGYANLSVDDLLEAQRRQSGARRHETVVSIQTSIARDQPFTVVAVPYEVRARRNDTVAGWGRDGLHDVLGYLSLSRESPDPDVERSTAETSTRAATTPTETQATETAPPTTAERPLRVTITDARPTENLNPVAVEFRGQEVATDLLYDPLARRVDGQIRPWLAAEWHWRSTAASPTADVTLREDLRWHDGERLTAEDVTFTYQFLQDTSLGSLETPVPAPRFRGRASLVESAEVIDDRRLRIKFANATPAVALRALTVPLLPEHVWSDLTGQAKVAGIDMQTPATEALVWGNRSPTGSGPFAFDSATYRESLVLEPFEDHFLARGETGDPAWDGVDESGGDVDDSPRGEVADLPERYATLSDAGSLRFTVVPSSGAAVELLGSDEADASGSPLHPSLVPAIGRDESLSLSAHESRSVYHVGYNLRRSPLRNPRFRRAVARLLDKPYLVDEVFDAYARPAASPLAGTPWLADDLAWTSEDPELPFPGSNGTLDVSRAREAFAEAGYRFTDDGRLVSG